MAFDAMFQPIQIGNLTIRNRVVSTAHAEVHATDGGMTTERYVKYYEEKAKGGCGLCICGGSSPVSIDSPSWWSSVNLATDRIIPHFQNLSEAVHKHGGKIMIQITTWGVVRAGMASTGRTCCRRRASANPFTARPARPLKKKISGASSAISPRPRVVPRKAGWMVSSFPPSTST